MVLAVTAAITLAFGVILGVGGVWLSSLGGSAYYLIIGISLSAIGLSLFQRRAEALWFYGAVVGATLVWAIMEVGLDWWPLAARGGVIVLLGLWLITPFVTRKLKWGSKEATGRTRLIVIGPLAVAILASIGVGVVSYLFVDLHDTEGALPGQVANLPASAIPAGDWPNYARTLSGNRWSPLGTINTGNVDRLEVAWTYNLGDVPGGDSPATLEVTPLKVGETVYLCSPGQVAIALDAATGAERWRHDPVVDEAVLAQRQTCRGVAYHAEELATGACAARVYLATADGRLLALDAETGEPCADFGTGGTVDLWQSMPHHLDGAYLITSPPVVARDKVLIASSVADATGALPSGVVRAYDLLTGRLIWNFDAGNPDSITPRRADQTFTDHAPNITAMMSVDEALNLVYVPTGNAPPVHYGPTRSTQAEDLSSAVLALDLNTGRMMWSFQTVHHDLWDMDIAAQPVLVDLTVRNVRVPVVIQATQQGDVFMLDRRTGLPVIAADEAEAPQDGVADGDFVELTQPASALSFAPATLTEEDMWGLTMFDQLACRIWFQSLLYEGRFTPPSVQGTLVYPGTFGVFNWGGVTVDPQRQVMIGSPSYIAHQVVMVPRPELPAPEPTETEPVEVAAATPETTTPATPAPATPAPATPAPATPAPAAPATPATPVAPPAGAPAAGAIGNPAANAPADNPPARLATPAATPAAAPAPAPTPVAAPAVEVAAAETPAPPVDPRPLFTAEIAPFLSWLGVPCQSPPWGYVAGVDLTTGRMAWQHAAGTVQDVAPVPLPLAMGVPSLGGPLATAGGVVFLSGTLDNFVRAYDVTTGEELWSSRLPAGGQSSPMTYATADGRQFLVVAAGGDGTIGTARGDAIIAYTLPASVAAEAAATGIDPALLAPPEPILPPTAAERLGNGAAPTPAPARIPAAPEPAAPAPEAAAPVPADPAVVPAPAAVDAATPAAPAAGAPATPAP
ncbi:MAG: outer membrane protein assembly factor BamB family protein [Bauldia sp.]